MGKGKRQTAERGVLPDPTPPALTKPPPEKGWVYGNVRVTTLGAVTGRLRVHTLHDCACPQSTNIKPLSQGGQAGGWGQMPLVPGATWCFGWATCHMRRITWGGPWSVAPGLSSLQATSVLPREVQREAPSGEDLPAGRVPSQPLWAGCSRQTPHALRPVVVRERCVRASSRPHEAQARAL